MDQRYLAIVIRNINDDLEAIKLWNKEGKDEKSLEYFDDVIKRVNELKNKIEL